MTPDDVIPLHLADVTYPESHPLAGQDGPVLAFAIRHPDGIVLFDTGIGEGNAWIDENYRPRSRGVREALVAARLDPDAVRAIVNSHLHFDHCGQNRAFPGVPIRVQRTELELARAGGPHRSRVGRLSPSPVRGGRRRSRDRRRRERPRDTRPHIGAPVGDGTHRRRPRAHRRAGRGGRPLVRDRAGRRERAPAARAECRPDPLLTRSGGAATA